MVINSHINSTMLLPSDSNSYFNKHFTWFYICWFRTITWQGLMKIHHAITLWFHGSEALKLAYPRINLLSSSKLYVCLSFLPFQGLDHHTVVSQITKWGVILDFFCLPFTIYMISMPFDPYALNSSWDFFSLHHRCLVYTFRLLLSLIQSAVITT